MADDLEQEPLCIDDHPNDVIAIVADAAATIIGNLGAFGVLVLPAHFLDVDQRE